jgi:hypothetical protein
MIRAHDNPLPPPIDIHEFVHKRTIRYRELIWWTHQQASWIPKLEGLHVHEWCKGQLWLKLHGLLAFDEITPPDLCHYMMRTEVGFKIGLCTDMISTLTYESRGSSHYEELYNRSSSPTIFQQWHNLKRTPLLFIINTILQPLYNGRKIIVFLSMKGK